MKQELEELRHHYGPDWLQSVATQKRLGQEYSKSSLASGNTDRASPSQGAQASPSRNGSFARDSSSEKIIHENSPANNETEKYTEVNETATSAVVATMEESHLADLTGDSNTVGRGCEDGTDVMEGKNEQDVKWKARESTSSEIMIYNNPSRMSSLENENDTDDIDYGEHSLKGF